MDFSNRNDLFRRSAPGCNRREKYECNSNNNSESNVLIKYRGNTLQNFKRDDYLNSSGGRVKLSKRNSEQDVIGIENYQSGNNKLMNLIKSGFHLSKYKSKSKINLQDKRQSLHLDSQLSKSEENLTGVGLDWYLSPIGECDIYLNPDKPMLYAVSYTSDMDPLYRELVILDKNCSVQTVHSSIVSGQKFCFQIIKRLQTDLISKSILGMNFSDKISREHTTSFSKSCSFTSRLRDDKLASLTCGPVVIVRCQSANQRNEWVMRLKKHINPNIDHMVRHEDILRIWIQEAKNLSPKKRYFCEIRLDQILYGRTNTKCMNEMVFWGDEFQFPGLKSVRRITISVYRMLENKKKKDKSELIATIDVPCADLCGNTFVEKWYYGSTDVRVSTENIRTSNYKATNLSSEDGSKPLSDYCPMIRIKARYRPLQIIPIKCYQMLLDCVIENSVGLVTSLEDHLKVKSKEEFVIILILILESKKRHLIFLVDLVLMEVFKADQNVLLRGNSMATKAMEFYLKLIGGKFLSIILSDMIAQVTEDEIDCEVDPLRIQNLKDQSLIAYNQKKLLSLVDMVWKKIFHNSHLIPKDLKLVFTMIRDKLGNNMSTTSTSLSLIDQVISSCLFLRFICPAIMSPFLFGLANEYSENSCINRTFTLVAKCIQSLANFSQTYHGKEGYMTFIQDFLLSKTKQMHTFILEISTNKLPAKSTSPWKIDYPINIAEGSPTTSEPAVDLGLQLAELTHQLDFHLTEIPLKDHTPLMVKVRSILMNMFTIFPKLNSYSEEPSQNNMSLNNNLRSQIPVRKYSTSPSLALNQLNQSGTMSSSQTQFQNSEDKFGSFPSKSKLSKQISKDNTPESIEENCADIWVSLNDEASTSNYSQSTKMLNEKEIITNWDMLVDEVSVTQSNASPTLTKCKSRTYSQNSDISLDSNSATPLPKVAPTRQANIYRRIQRKSNANKHSENSSQTEEARPKLSRPTMNHSLEFSHMGDYTTFTSEESDNKTDRHSPKVCSSFDAYNTSNENLQTILRSPHNTQTLSYSISSDEDLESFLLNEILRLELFFKYYKVQLPVMYKGNSTEQYKGKIVDESTLKLTLLKKSNFRVEEIVSYIKSSYRLLKSIKKPGDISTEFTVQSIMDINKRIQEIIEHEFQGTNVDNSDIGPNAKKISRSQSQSDCNLKSPLTKYSKHSLDYKSLWVFERC